MSDIPRKKLERWLDDNFFKTEAGHEFKRMIDTLRPHLQGSMFESLQLSADTFSIEDLRSLIIDEFNRQQKENAEHNQNLPFQMLLDFAITQAKLDLIHIAINPDDHEAELLIHELFSPFSRRLSIEQLVDFAIKNSENDARVIPFEPGKKK